MSVIDNIIHNSHFDQATQPERIFPLNHHSVAHIFNEKSI